MVLAEPLEGAQPRLLTVQMVSGPDVLCSFVYLYEQLWGGCWVPDISSFVQGSFVSLSDVQLKMTSCCCPEVVTRPGCPSHQAHFPPQSRLSSVHPRGLYSPFNSSCLTSGILPHQPTGPHALELSCFRCQGLYGRRHRCREQRSESKNAPGLRICTVVCPDQCFPDCPEVNLGFCMDSCLVL